MKLITEREEPEYESKRISSGFLWIPRLGHNKEGKQEARWLQYAKWEETYWNSDPYRGKAHWCLLNWID